MAAADHVGASLCDIDSSSLVGVALQQRGGDKSQRPGTVAIGTPNPPHIC
jgi:hypothetical protein